MRILAAALWLAAVSLGGARAQRAEPLRKSDLIRLLTGGALSRSEIADLVRRDCLSFTPTARDRQDLQALGADSAIMDRIDACARAATTRPPAAPVAVRTAPSPPPRRPRPGVARDAPAAPAPRAPAPQPPPPAHPAPRPHPAALPAAGRTGFLSGTGQRGVVGQRAALPLVFEVRDSAGSPLAGIAVAMSATNGRLVPSGGGGSGGGGGGDQRTDSLGRVRTDLIFGEQAAATVVTAAVGAIVRQATLYPSPGSAARVVATYKGREVERQLVIDPDVPALLHVTVQDAFGNGVASPGVVVAVADEGILKVRRVTPDSLGAVVLLQPGRPGGGSTGLTMLAGRVRLDLSAAVRARP